MPDDIQSQIDHIADRRFLGCVARFLVTAALAAVAAVVLVKLVPRGNGRVIVAFVFSGYLLSWSTLILTPGSRRFVRLVLMALSLVWGIGMVIWSLLGYPIRMHFAIAPLAFLIGLILAQPNSLNSQRSTLNDDH